MIGIVIVGHGGLARELLAAMEHVVGPQPAASAVSTGPEDDLSAKQAEIAAAVAAANHGAGVALVTDMFGGTPCNLSIGCMGDDVQVIYGANLPLLVKLAKMRDKPLEEATNAALEAGRKYIDSAAAMLTA